MNEPAVFNILDKTTPNDCVHFNGIEDIEHREIHNLYGQEYNKVAYNSLKNKYTEKDYRVFVLSRAIYSGSQQFGFHWTGDNSASLIHLKYSLEMLLTLNYCGITNSGADVGGFFGNPSENLLAFWFEVGTFYSFFRGHSFIKSIRREPWKFSRETLERIKNAITLKYNLLIFFYTECFLSNKLGKPRINHYKEIDYLYEIGNSFILMINDVDDDDKEKEKEEEEKVEKEKEILLSLQINEKELYDFRTGLALPKNNKHIFNSISSEADLANSLNIYILGGRIIPWVEKALINSEYTIKNPYSLMIFPDEKGKAEGYMYLDDGKTNNNTTINDYIFIHYELKNFKELTAKVVHHPKLTYNANNDSIIGSSMVQISYFQNFYENIYLFGFNLKSFTELKNVDVLIEGFSIPLSLEYRFEEESNLLLTTELMIKITDNFTLRFNYI